jgi:hypothetical protein
MDRDGILDLVMIVRREVEDYAKGGIWKAITYPVSDHARQHYAVLVIPDYPRKDPAAIVVAARVVDDKILIEEDITDRPLWEELVRAGIPREKIICLYAGEQLPSNNS